MAHRTRVGTIIDKARQGWIMWQNFSGRLYITIGIVLALTIVGVILWRVYGPTTEVTVQRDPETARVITREAAPENISVPKVGDSVPENVAAPQTANVAGSNTERAIQVYEGMRIEGDKFEPNTIIIKHRDLISMRVMAVDKDYDLTIPDYSYQIKIPKGSEKFWEMSANEPGTFLFYCAACGGPERGPVGKLIVAPQ